MLLLLPTACTPGGGEVIIGVIGPAKGPYADLGRQMRDGATLAAEEINRRGGIEGKDVKIKFRDDSDRSRLGSIMRSLVADGVTAIVGPEDVSTVASKDSIPARSGLPVLAISSAGKIAGNRHLFRMTPSNEVMAEALSSWLSDVRKFRKVAVVSAADPWGKDGSRAMHASLRARGVEPVATHELVPDTPDVTPLAQVLKASGAEALVAWLPAADAARLLLATKRIDWKVQFTGPDSLFSAAYRSIAGDATDNSVVVLPRATEETWLGESVRDWSIDYHKRFTLLPIADQRTLVADLPSVAIASYDAVKLVADAVVRSKSAHAKDVSDSLRKTRGVAGVMRQYSFSTDREAYGARDVSVARFFNLAFVFDVDPGADLDRQAAFYKVQVSGFHVPDAYRDTPEGKAVYDRILEDVLTDPEKVEFFRDYAPPREPPGQL